MLSTQSKINKTIGRLKKRSDFLRVQQSGKKWVAKGLIVEVVDSAYDKPHYGITVSKKTSKLAVTRNRIKRRLRSVIKEVFPQYTEHHIDIVVIGRIAAEKREYSDLKQDLVWCLGKLGYQKDEQS